MPRWLVAALLALAVLAGCATPAPPPKPPPVVTAPEPEPPPPPPPPRVSAPEPRRDTLKHLADRKLKAMPVRPLSASAKCSFRDITGYRGHLQLTVDASTVKDFTARVDVPRHGSCRFRLADFHQTDVAPAVVLAARSGDCKVSLWEQADQVTVAFRNCRTECSGDSVDYLWPILVDNRNGRCS